MIAKIQTMDIYTGLQLLCDMAEQIKHGHKQLKKPPRNTLFTHCNAIIQFLSVLKHDRVMSGIFQLLFSTSKLLLIEHDHVEILLKLGFVDAAKEIIEDEVNRRRSETKHNAATPKSEFIL